jgi:hypothetical protein
VGRQLRRNDPARVGIHPDVQKLWGRRRGDGTIVAGSVMELPHVKTS